MTACHRRALSLARRRSSDSSTPCRRRTINALSTAMAKSLSTPTRLCQRSRRLLRVLKVGFPPRMSVVAAVKAPLSRRCSCPRTRAPSTTASTRALLPRAFEQAHRGGCGCIQRFEVARHRDRDETAGNASYPVGQARSFVTYRHRNRAAQIGRKQRVAAGGNCRHGSTAEALCPRNQVDVLEDLEMEVPA